MLTQNRRIIRLFRRWGTLWHRILRFAVPSSLGRRNKSDFCPEIAPIFAWCEASCSWLKFLSRIAIYERRNHGHGSLAIYQNRTIVSLWRFCTLRFWTNIFHVARSVRSPSRNTGQVREPAATSMYLFTTLRGIRLLSSRRRGIELLEPRGYNEAIRT